jgi:hypothetical protein
VALELLLLRQEARASDRSSRQQKATQRTVLLSGGYHCAVARILTSELATPVTLAKAKHSPDDGGVPSGPGLYAWWTTTDDALHDLPRASQAKDSGLRLLYVGIAPSRASSSATLRSRVLGQHVGGNLASSTFRRSLAALLWEQQGWRPVTTPGGKIAFAREDNAALTRWQEQHLRLAWCVVFEPWTREGELIAEMLPPLNLAENGGHPFYRTMSAARARLMTQARANPL